MESTIKQALVTRLVEKGMWEDGATSVVDAMIAESEQSEDNPMKGRWSHPLSGYPESFMAVLMVSANDFALAWIEENQPQAWYRCMFEPQDSPAL